MEKSILYYKFVNVPDPEMTVRWQHELCTRLGLLGRIIVSPQGINGTLGGDIESLRAYKRAMNVSGIFRGIHYKWDVMHEGQFPKLSVRSREELVTFGAPEEIKVDDETGVIGGGERLRPREVHDLINKYGDEVVFFDGRNLYESSVGKFKNAVIPQVNTSREFIAEIEKPEYEKIKDRPIVSYCTGGIRCEILSVLMKNRGFNNVYQLDGGIVTYGKEFGDKGFWEGKCYVFDRRIQQAFSDKSAVISSCGECGTPTERFSHCTNESCGAQMIICKECESQDGPHLCLACAT